MTYDLIIIGAGPGGYIAAERAAQGGLKVLLVEKDRLGGVCLNCGCIPSKTLIHSAKVYHQALYGEAYGVRAAEVAFDFARAMERKEKVVAALRNGIAGMMKKLKVEVVDGTARLWPGGQVEIDGAVHDARHVILATGSAPARPPIPGLDLPGVVDSTGILELDRLPGRLTVIGGGVIGCEFACLFGSLGIPVDVVEMLPEICPPLDPAIAKILRSELGKRNITFHLGARVDDITESQVRFRQGGEPVAIDRELVLVAAGRAPNVAGMGLGEAGLDFDDRGICVDDQCRTNLPGVFAIGDVTGKAALAHTASRMGEVAVNTILGRRDRMRYHAIPGVVYTLPEAASVGLTEAQATARGIPVQTAALPMSVNGRFLAEHDRDRGQVRVVVHAETRVLLGVHMVGGACSEMIWGAAALIESEFRVPEIEEIVFPHPTTSEIIRDAVLAVR